MDEGGVDSVGAYSNGHIQCAGIVRAVLYPKGVLLKISRVLYIWLPDQLLTDGLPTDVRQLVTNHVKECVTKS